MFNLNKYYNIAFMICIRFQQDLEMTFTDCIENCEDQGCASNCRRDFYIKIDCKFSSLLL